MARLSRYSNIPVKGLPCGTLLVSHYTISVLRGVENDSLLAGEREHLASTQLSWKLMSRRGHVTRI